MWMVVISNAKVKASFFVSIADMCLIMFLFGARIPCFSDTASARLKEFA